MLPEEAPWLEPFERELLGFPNTRHDDQVDALAHLLAWTARVARPRMPIGQCQVFEIEEPDRPYGF